MKNCIFVIKPYKWEGMWDSTTLTWASSKNLRRRCGHDDRRATSHIPNATRASWPSSRPATSPMRKSCWWAREEGGGNVYRWAEKGMEGWLCPALLRYFTEPPEKLYIQVKAAG